MFNIQKFKIPNYKIEATVLICGAILMALEIMGGKLLAPYYGDTVYIWGSIIGVFLLSLSFGYYVGGRLADKKPDEYVLSIILIITGISILIIPFIFQPIITMFNSLPRTIAPLCSVITIFIVPSLLLGTVSPFALKLKAKDIHKIGKLSGNLYALATIGSVIGTFLTTFVLILILPNQAIFFSLSIVSLLIAIMLSKKKLLAVICLMLVLIFVLSLIPGHASIPTINSTNTSDRPLDIKIETLYGLVEVRDRGSMRTLTINGGVMSETDLTNLSRTAPGWEYVDCMEIPYAMNPNIKEVLTMGLGAGNFQRNLNQKYNASMDNVEINDKIVEIAAKYFNTTPSDSFRIYVDDARAFAQATDKKYDYIAIDVVHFDPTKGYKVPTHLITQEFFTLLKNHLNPHGIVSMNLVGTDRSKFIASEYETINSVFDNTYAFNCGTQVIIASLDKYNITELKETTNDARELAWYYNLKLYNDSIIFTDSYTPINSFAEVMVGNIPNSTI
jgi:spermidine synthase/uncharacterized membrane protein YozB (DUF420 family)